MGTRALVRHANDVLYIGIDGKPSKVLPILLKHCKKPNFNLIYVYNDLYKELLDFYKKPSTMQVKLTLNDGDLFLEEFYQQTTRILPPLVEVVS